MPRHFTGSTERRSTKIGHAADVRAVPSIALLRGILDLNPGSGELIWKVRPQMMFTSKRACSIWNSRYSGRPALAALHGSGYRVGRINNVMFRAHRVIWAIHYGEWPELQVDHINGNKVDNRICNLRRASRYQNQLNKPMRADSTNPFKGVRWHKRDQRWVASICHMGKAHHLGTFINPEDAHAAYCLAAKQLHGDFARFE